jgi:hypothetical protein
MPTFERCDKSVNNMADALLQQFDTHQPLIDAKVKFDFVFAFCDRDEKSGEPTNNALSKGGVKCLGMARKIALKDRALGRGDAEISIDGDWWKDESISDDERRALLDHEMHHIAVKVNRYGVFDLDDLGRPKLFLRPHDYEFGWFDIIAKRHGVASIERKQAARMMLGSGQLYWPEIAALETSSTRFQKVAARH